MAFAVVQDVAARLEEAALIGVAEDAATAQIEKVTALICVLVGESDEDWFDDLTTVQKALIKAITVDVVCRAMASPQGLDSASETLGAYSRSERYGRDPYLTAAEQQLVTRLAGAGSSGSVRVPALPHDVYVTESPE